MLVFACLFVFSLLPLLFVQEDVVGVGVMESCFFLMHPK